MLVGQAELHALEQLLRPREGRLILLSRPSAINAVGATPNQVRGGYQAQDLVRLSVVPATALGPFPEALPPIQRKN